MLNDQRARQGYLLLADISGYTAFLTGTELEHAHAIIHELTAFIRGCLVPSLRFVKVEGDAVFCYAEGSSFRDGERLVELIEACYFDFSNRLLDMQLATTCSCNACAAIGSLGLKFVAHYGNFVIDREADREDLAGPDVILVHRLLKNTISDASGAMAYLFLTENCLERMPASFDLPAHREVYESFGEVRGGVHDLEPVLTAMRAARREYITPHDADFETTIDLPVPPAVAWRYQVDPFERQRWACRQFSKQPDRVTPNPRGRVGAGATTHCNHGPGTWLREFVDWRPFAYFTCRTTAPVIGRFLGPRPEIETVEFFSNGERGTRVVTRVRLTDRSRFSLFTFRAQRRFLAAFWRRANAALLRIAEEDGAALGV